MLHTPMHSLHYVLFIMEGVVGRTADMVTRRVVDGVCGHWHDGKRSNGEVVEDRP